MDSVTASLTVSPVNMCGAWSTALLLLALTLPAALSVNVAPLFEPAGTQARRTLVAGAPAAATAAARSPKHRARQLLQQADKPALTHFGGMDMEGELACGAVWRWGHAQPDELPWCRARLAQLLMPASAASTLKVKLTHLSDSARLFAIVDEMVVCS